jgi:hypothetical protein
MKYNCTNGDVMSLIWVAKPGVDLNIPREFSLRIDKCQAQVTAINDASQEGVCHICAKKEVSREHAPSKQAFNKKDLVEFRIAKPLKNFLEWKSNVAQGGNIVHTLCIDCNNRSGAWYNGAYVKFARECSRYAKQENAGKEVEIKVTTYPLRIVKQAVIHVLTTSQSALIEQYLGLKKFLLEKEAISKDIPIYLGVFLRANKGSRSSGLTIGIDLKKEEIELYSEFSFWPLGWVLSFEKESLRGLLDVSAWAQEGYDDKKDLVLKIPCYYAVYPSPKDFRSPENVKNGD